jgi:1-deoxy-D-xylulose-5-phosphate synthase
MRFVKPLDTALIDRLAAEHGLLVTLEDNAVAGGAGSGVAEYLATAHNPVALLHLGLPDRFIDHDSRAAQLAAVGLDAAGVVRAIGARAQRLQLTASGDQRARPNGGRAASSSRP